MQMIKVMLFAAAALTYAAAGTAAEPAKSAKSASASKGQSDRVCFAEKTTGSHLRRRICMTREEQERRRVADQQAVQRMRRSTGAGGVGSKDP
jgi:hypothetical protein